MGHETPEIKRDLQFIPTAPGKKTRNHAAAAVALVVAYWIDDLDTYYDVRTGDLRNTDVLETYIRDHADLAMAIDLKSSRRHGGGLVSPFLGGYDLDQDFARITQVFGGPTQADAYAAPRRAELLAERDRLRARIATIDGLLR